MKVKIKKLHEDAVVPSYGKPGDAGMDLVAVSQGQSHDIITYKTGLSVEIPEGYVGLLFSRSSVYKTDLVLANSVGVIDSGYRGEIMLKYKVIGDLFNVYNVGDRVGQLIIMPYPQIEFGEVEELSDTERGEGGFGSTGS